MSIRSLTATVLFPVLAVAQTDPAGVGSLDKVQKIAVLPAQVEYTLVNLTTENERRPNVERTLARIIAGRAEEQIAKYRYMVRMPQTDLPEARRQEQESEFELLYSTFHAASTGSAETEALKSSLARAAAAVAARMDADAILLTRYVAFRKSDGQVFGDLAGSTTLGALTGIARTNAREGGIAGLVLIDATGKVLWRGGGRYAAFPGIPAKKQPPNFAHTHAGAVGQALLGLPDAKPPPN